MQTVDQQLQAPLQCLARMKPNQQVIALVIVFSMVFQASAQDAPKPLEPSTKHFADVIDIAPWGMAGPDGRPRGIYSTIFSQFVAADRKLTT
jgi:hypothetical protein